MKTTAFDAYEHIYSLLKTWDSSFLEIGRILADAQVEQPWLFETLLRMPGLGRRRAYYLVAISRAFDPLSIDKEKLAAVGWTKLARLVSHVTPQSVNALLSLALSHTDRQLKAILKGKKPDMNARVLLLYLSQAEYAQYAAAVVRFGAKKSGNGLIDQERGLMNLVAAVNGR